MPRKFLALTGVVLLALLAAISAARADLVIQFDYTYDTGNFFGAHPNAKTLLEAAAQFYDTRIKDSLLAINATAQSALDHGADTWTTDAFNPSDPNNPSLDIKIDNLVVPANTLIVFVGGTTNLTGSELGLGGPGGFSSTGFSQTWLDTVAARGQTGALADSPSDFGPWGGSIAFSSTANWYYDSDPTTNDVPGGQNDFFSVALHELGHLLGIGTATSWDAQIGAGNFTGLASTAANNGIHPALDAAHGHWINGTMSTIYGTNTPQEAALDPSLTVGTRKLVTTLDMAGLQDIGWLISNPAITANPANLTVTAGNLAVFSVTAQGTGTLSYQWQISTNDGVTFDNLANGNGVAGAFAANLTIATFAHSAERDGYQYRCVVTNSAGTAASAAAILSVLVPPHITTQPASVVVLLGQSANFTVVQDDTGTPPITFQWKKNGFPIPDAINDSYQIPSVTANNAGTYTVVISNAWGSITSANATLTIGAAPAISKPPVNVAVIAGKPANFAITATGTAPLAYHWQVSTDGGSVFANLTDGGGVKGSATAKLALTTTANNTAGNGNIYQCLVTNTVGNITSPAASLTVGIVPKITAQPAAKSSAVLGNTANFTITSSGSGTLLYQWQFSLKGATWSNLTNNADISGATAATLSVNATASGFYRCIVTNPVGTVTTAKSALTVNLPAEGIYFGTFSGKAGAGKFASLVQSNDDTLILGFNTTKKTGFITPIFTLNGNGTFATGDGGDNTLAGTMISTTIMGNLTSSAGNSTLKGTHKANTGAQSTHAGYYTGTYSGSVSGTLTALLASDGAFLVYSVSTVPDDNGDGGQGTIAKTNKFTLTTVDGMKLTGTLNPDADEITGTWKAKNGQTGTFDLTLDTPL